MTLNASGPISLGGATTGQSINIELSKAATATVSLNDANVRSLAGVASGAITMPTNFYGKSAGFTNWQQANASSVFYSPASVTFDSSNNYYSATNGSTATFSKANSVGTNQFTRRFTTGSAARMATSPTGNSYIANNDTGFANVVKYNSSGVLQWQRSIGSAAPPSDTYIDDICIDPSENVYVIGKDVTPGAMFIMKFNSSGTQQWVRQMVASATPEDRAAITYFDDSTNTGVAYLFLTGLGSGQPNNICAGTYLTTGVLLGQVSLASPTRYLANDNIGISVNTSGQFLFGFSTANTFFNTSFQQYIAFVPLLVWQKEFTSGDISTIVTQVSSDGTNYYTAGRITGYAGPAYMKFASDGTLLAQRYVNLGVQAADIGVYANSTGLALGAVNYLSASYLYKAPQAMTFGTATAMSVAVSDWATGTVTVTDSAGGQFSGASARTETSIAGSYTLTQLL